MMGERVTEDENLNELIKELEFTDAQKKIVTSARVSLDSQINRSRIISNIYVANQLEKSIGKLIDSNERLAVSNDRFSRAANWLTVGLLIVATVQLIIQIFFQ